MARKSRGTGNRMTRAAAQKLESLQRAGVTHLKKPSRRPASISSSDPTEPPKAATSSTPATPAMSAKKNTASQKSEPRAAASVRLAKLQKKVVDCTRCRELADQRTQTVFGVGSPDARLVFLGEAPGADEDRQGEPFVGRAGKLLTKIIEACTLRREEVYILNVLKCRPPGNRNPGSDEADHCREYLDAQLDIIQPEYICCLGSVAAQNLLKTTTSIGRLRGQLHDYQGIQVMCTYHPAYLLRNPNAKRQVWDDMQMLMGKMGIELPQKS